MNPKVDRHPTDEEFNQAIAKRPDLDRSLSRDERRKHQRGGRYSAWERRQRQPDKGTLVTASARSA